MNEFYEVIFEDGAYFNNPNFFKNKDSAFAYAKQAYLNYAPYSNDKEMEEDLACLNENYYIHGFVCINVRGFED